MTVAGSDWSRRLRDTRAVYWTRFSSNQPGSLRAPPPPFFFLSGCRETGLLATRGMREEERKEDKEEGC